MDKKTRIYKILIYNFIIDILIDIRFKDGNLYLVKNL